MKKGQAPYDPGPITDDTLIGATILSAHTSREDELILLIRPREGAGVRDTVCIVMADPEGNGPGAMHLYDHKTGDDLGTLGGR